MSPGSESALRMHLGTSSRLSKVVYGLKGGGLWSSLTSRAMDLFRPRQINVHSQ